MVRFLAPLYGRLVGATLLTSVLTSACSGPPQTGQAPPGFPVQIQEVATSTVRESSEFVGALEAQERVALRPETAGRVVTIFVAPGQRVQQGTPILDLKADRSRAQVSGAVADVAAAQSARNTAAARLRAAEAERERAAADVQLRTAEYQRYQSLVNQGAESQQTLDQAINARDTAIASLKSAEEEIRAAQASVNEAEALLESAKADQAVAREDLQDTQVRAPITGVVGNIPIKVGDYVTTNDTLTSIIQNQSLDLNLSVPIERAPQLRVGIPVELVNQQNQPIVTGRISFVSPEVNSTEQSVLAKASFPNGGALRDGQFVRARVLWQSGSGILVPTTAVTRIAGQTFVYIAEPAEKPAADGKPQQVARQRLVKLGEIQGSSYQVLSGVKPGEKVVVSGILNLSDGAPILPEQPVSEQ